MDERTELEFETRYYLAEARRLQRQSMALMRESDDMMEHAVLTWQRARELRKGVAG